MSNDLIPTQEPGTLTRFIESLNVPQVIAGPAGRAISRLVAGAVDIPAAYLESFTHAIKDKTNARSIVSNEVANAAAKLVAGDTDIVARAAHNLLAKEYRKQKNKEEIARKTIELLESRSSQDAAGSSDQQSRTTKDVEEDWLNVFEKYAEDATSDRLRDVWSRVLAGEIRSPKTFSLQTLRFISELDEQSARLFEK